MCIDILNWTRGLGYFLKNPNKWIERQESLALELLLLETRKLFYLNVSGLHLMRDTLSRILQASQTCISF